MKRVFLLCLLLSILSLLGAGDKAEFVNLGFSENGKYFMFGNYGFSQEDAQCYSNLFLVDVPSNVFVPGGVFHGEYNNLLSPGQSSIGALFSLLEESTAKRKEYNIDFLNTGRPLYIRLDDNPESEENLESEMNELNFKDFLTGSRFKVLLNQTIEESSSRFYIDLNIVTANGLEKNLRIGHPDYSRRGIVNYTINRIIINPDSSSLIIIVAKTDTDGNIRYMVETAKLN